MKVIVKVKNQKYALVKKQIFGEVKKEFNSIK